MLKIALGIMMLQVAWVEPSVAAPAIESAPLALTRDQLSQCLALEAAGSPTPWWCGRREGDLAPPFDEACPDRQWVGYRLAPGACPAAPSAQGVWTVHEPFARSLDDRLRRVCAYTWTPALAERPTPDVAALPDVRGLRLERDCEVVAGHALPEPVSDALFSAWSNQVELPDWSDAEAFQPPSIRVAIIDGGFGGELPNGAAPDTVNHAVVVSSVVRAIACPERGASALCAASVPNYNAMPYTSRGILGELGGYFGTQMGFAEAVVEAVDTWRLEAPNTRPVHLILNLSLGWDGDYDVTTTPRVAGVTALWAARYATCQGALLIAAAGNQAGADDAGPLFPAAWEALPRACGGAPVGVYSPLVHAVGAVNGRDGELAINRVGGTPRLVAPAALVVVPEDTVVPESEMTTPLSGTSLATAAASGTAALVWSMRPGMTPDAVMQLIYRSGEPLGLAADFGQPAQRRRLSVGRAFARACPEGVAVGACPAADSRPSLPGARAAGEDAQADFANIVDALLTDPVDVLEDPNAELPDVESSYFAPWIVPQPGEPNCPICGFVGTTLFGKLDPMLDGAVLGQPEIQVNDLQGNKHFFPLEALPTQVSFKIDLSGTLGGLGLKTAWLRIPAILGGKAVLTSSELFIQ